MRTRLHSILLSLDIAVFLLAMPLAATLRFEGFGWFQSWGPSIGGYLLVTLPLRLLMWERFHMSRRRWSSASVPDILDLTWAIGWAVAIGLVTAVAGWMTSVVPSEASQQRTLGVTFLLEWVIFALFLPAMRIAPRLWAHRRLHRSWAATRDESHRPSKRVLIVGAGEAGVLISRQLMQYPRFGLQPVGFVDDDIQKHGQRIHGLPVFGGSENLSGYIAAQSADEIIVAAPSAPGALVRRIVETAQRNRVPVRTMPSIEQGIVASTGQLSLQPIDVTDLLRRDPIQTDLAALEQLVKNDCVLVTGAGGSIGSELARQILARQPAKLVVLGHGENSIFELMADLLERKRRNNYVTEIVPVIADVREAARIQGVWEMHRPRLVLHAAAHKHVPLMEENVADAISNNILGTQTVVNASERTGVERFILISSDKAVRPTNVMGATKRGAEQVVQLAAARQQKPWGCVRFGNVLGSRGSVIPTFLRQIQRGGPLTLTHDGMTRYFMLIPEAVQLVLQATLFAEGGDVFVLDMGEPVRIRTLAEDVIRLAGLTPGVDIDIQVTGARPGEKIHEELFFSAETTLPTRHAKIMRARQVVAPAETESLTAQAISMATGGAVRADLIEALKKLVPEYAPDAALAQSSSVLSLASAKVGVLSPQMNPKSAWPQEANPEAASA